HTWSKTISPSLAAQGDGGVGGSASLFPITSTNNAVDILQFTTWDTGTTWYGRSVGHNVN
ncbi:MAG: hypothetical protein VX772_00295, partial [Bacteroidota bacterium]|nr:hypothetical protein [Bacteroidota bacterium]